MEGLFVSGYTRVRTALWTGLIPDSINDEICWKTTLHCDIASYGFMFNNRVIPQRMRLQQRNCFNKICPLQNFPDCIYVCNIFDKLILRAWIKMTKISSNSLDFCRFRSSLKSHPLWVTLKFNIVKLWCVKYYIFVIITCILILAVSFSSISISAMSPADNTIIYLLLFTPRKVKLIFFYSVLCVYYKTVPDPLIYTELRLLAS